MKRRAFICGGMAAILAHRRAPAFCVAMRNGMMRRGAPTPPPLPYDAEVEYLESTGTQWIDTGIIPRVGLITEIRFLNTIEPSGSTTPPERMFGAAVGRTTGYYIQRYYNPGFGGVAFSLASFVIHLVANGDCEWHNAVLCSSNSGRYVEIDSVRTIDTSTTVPSVTNHLLLFAISNTNGTIGGNSYARIAHCSIRDTSTGQLLLDLIPVRFTNELDQSEGAMYDRLGVGGMNPDGSLRTDGIYRNRGTGALIWAEKQ